MVLNAVYEADSLISAMEKRANDYKNVREQLLVLQKTLDQIAQSHDLFQGEGAEAVQSFYQEQASLVDEWLILVDMQIAFHNGVAADAADSNLAGHTAIHMEFLERELANGYRRSKEID
ncbi:T7SS effector LXG polymorphic toxin [Bacillus sp. FSL H8-0547]